MDTFDLAVTQLANDGHYDLAKKLQDDMAALEADALRYRHLEELCRKGTYRGIISREEVDASMATTAAKGL